MSVLESSNLRDLLRVRDDDDGRDALAGLTLAAVLGCESLPKRPSRTLLEIIKDEESGAAYRGLIPPTESLGNKKTWKSFRNRLRVRRTGVAFSSSSSSNPVNACDFIVDECDLRISNPVLIERRGVSVNSLFNSGNINGVSISGSNTSAVGQANTSSRAQEELRPEGEETGSSSVNEQRPASSMGLSSNEDSEEQRPTTDTSREDGQSEESVVGATTEEVVAAPPRVSLMALLEETDWNNGDIVEALEMETDEAEEGLGDENDEEGGNEGGEYVCCVCMVRHKGAAFIPCGHTFCRLCSRELWVNRGNCPLCNGYILEILDIF